MKSGHVSIYEIQVSKRLFKLIKSTIQFHHFYIQSKGKLGCEKKQLQTSQLPGVIGKINKRIRWHESTRALLIIQNYQKFVIP